MLYVFGAAADPVGAPTSGWAAPRAANSSADADSPSSQRGRVPATTTEPQATTADGSGEAQSPTEIAPQEEIARQLVERLAQLPEGSSIEGRPLTLSEALTPVGDPRRQIGVAQQYWDLVAAVARCRIRRQGVGLLEGLPEIEADRPWRVVALGEAKARVEEAELAVVEAQHRLADSAMLLSAEPLPLPANAPHVGPYRMYFEEIFAVRPAPASLWRIHRSLPLQQRAIENWSEAAVRAQAMIDEAKRAYRTGNADFGQLRLASEFWQTQQLRLIDAVLKYNHDIAEYAFTAVQAPRPGLDLASMLIDTGPSDRARQAGAANGATSVPAGDAGVRSAGLDESLGTGTATTPGKPQPTLAPPRRREDAGVSLPAMPDRVNGSGDARTDSAPAVDLDRPTAAPPAGALDGSAGASSAGNLPEVEPRETPETEEPRSPPLAPIPGLSPTEVPESDTPKPSRSRSAEPPSALPGAEASGAGAAGPANAPVAAPQAVPRRAERPIQAAAKAHAVYSGLVPLSGASRAKQLAADLYWDRALPEQEGQPLTLADALAEAPQPKRLEVIRAYWHARQSAAEYQAYRQTADLLREFGQAEVAVGRDQTDPWERALLAAATDEAKAAAASVEVQWRESRIRLAERLGRPLDAPGPIPTTVPHAGPYLLNEDKVSGPLAESWRFRRLEAAIPRAFDTLGTRATVIVQADALRAESAAASPRAADWVRHTRQQTRQTRAFLDALTEYNELIAEYVLLVLPEEVDAATLVESLVLSP
jgi:hypothetical protein